MAPAENHFASLPQELRRRIIKLACAAPGTWAALRMVDKALLEDCKVVGEWRFQNNNAYAFLKKHLATAGAERLALRFFDGSEATACLQNAIEGAADTLEEFLLVYISEEAFLSKERQDYLFAKLAECPKLRRSSLTLLNETLDVPAASMSGIGFRRLMTLELTACTILRFPLDSLPELTQLRLDEVFLDLENIRTTGRKLKELTLQNICGACFDASAPNLERIVVRGTHCLRLWDLPRLKSLIIDDSDPVYIEGFYRQAGEVGARISRYSPVVANLTKIVTTFKVIRHLRVGGIPMDIESMSSVFKNVIEMEAHGLHWRDNGRGVVDLEPEPHFDMLTMLTLDFGKKKTLNIEIAYSFLKRAKKLKSVTLLVDFKRLKGIVGWDQTSKPRGCTIRGCTHAKPIRGHVPTVGILDDNLVNTGLGGIKDMTMGCFLLSFKPLRGQLHFTKLWHFLLRSLQLQLLPQLRCIP